MSNRVLIKRGLSTNLDRAGVVAGELKYATDTKTLYWNGYRNVEIGGSRVIEVDYEDELPALSQTLLGRIYYVRDSHSYYYVRGIMRFTLTQHTTANQTMNLKQIYLMSFNT